MASLSLPRVLQQRKTSLELERENFEKFQAASIAKAINQIEHPVKEKHVRSAILGTFNEKCAETFWACTQRLPVQENRIIAWKFCHVLHKILREGHPQVIPNSQRHRSRIEDIGKLWGHLKEGYGKLIYHYCLLLTAKLDFHRRNPRFPGNLVLSREELDRIGENDINNYFQMSVEMFDYMDEILALQSAIFGSLDMSRSNSMTSSGQCRLAPLIPVIQDSSQLYDFCVKILFKLHASLPPDVLSGHRQRFLKQFRELRQFYLAASTLQYFKYLIQIPTLPENPPNFLIQAELRTYVTPVVILPPEEPPDPEPASTADLVDIGSMGTNGSISPDALTERDNLIEHLQNELGRQRFDIQRLIAEHQRAVQELSDRINNLEVELAKKDSELTQERLLKEDLLQQTEVVAKYHETEKKAKAIEEKFTKLKEVYTKLREEHIQLIRQKAGVDKALRGSDKMTKFARAANNLIVSIKADVDKQLSSIRTMETDTTDKTKLAEVLGELAQLQANADAASEQNEIRNLALSSKVDWMSAEKAQIESELQDLLSQKEELDVRLAEVQQELKVTTESSEKAQKTLFDKVLSESEAILQQTADNITDPALSSVTCTPGYFSSLLPRLEDSVNCLESQSSVDNIIRVSHLTAQFAMLGKATSNTAHDIEFGDRMASSCKEVSEACLSVLKGIRDCVKDAKVNVKPLREKISTLAEMANSLTNALKGDTTEIIGDLMENELASMEKAIEEAAKKIEEMLSQSRAADSGLKLEVNEKILDSCTTLMKAIRILVQKSKLLQAEIVAQGKGSASAKEFYKRNHQWTEGLISAAKAVGMGANFLLTAADEVVSGEGKMEKLIVASQGIAASTAQLVVASRVKAERNSNNLNALSAASKDVTHATGGVVATAKACGQLVEDSEELDVSGLSLHQAKRLEMEAQVRVLELESGLEKERLKLSALRRHHYQLAGETDGTTL